jgi:hypothetical protein
VIAADIIDKNVDETIECGACGEPVLMCDFGAIFIPVGTCLRIPYVLCLDCSARLRESDHAKQEVFAEVELRIGPMRGTA